MKKNLSVFLFFMLSMLLISMPVHASEKSKAYKSYKNWIKKGAKVTDSYGYVSKYKKFCLIDLDNDGVEELISNRVVNYAIDIYYIRSYKNGIIREITISSGVGAVGGFRGAAYYIPKKGLVYETSWGSANPHTYDTIYRLKKKKFVEIASGEYDQTYENNKKKNTQWNGKKVSAKKYNRKFKSLFNMKKAKKFDDLKFISKKKMLKNW